MNTVNKCIRIQNKNYKLEITKCAKISFNCEGIPFMKNTHVEKDRSVYMNKSVIYYSFHDVYVI